MNIFEDFNDITVHFSSLLGAKVLNEDGLNLGKVTDLFVDYEEMYPQVLAIQYMKSNQFFYVNWRDLKSFNVKRIVITKDCEIGRSRTYPKISRTPLITGVLSKQFSGDTIEFPAIGKVVLDRQIVDTSGKKVVRVNDIELIKAGQSLRVTHASIGFRSMVRRIGYEKVIDSVIKFINPNAKYLKTESLINWKYVHAIPDKTVHKNVKLNLSDKDIENIHPADLADILEDLDNNARDVLFSGLDPQKAAETLSEVEQDIQSHLIKNDSPDEVAKIIENMGTDEAADILNELSKDYADEIISKIEDGEIKEEIQELLEYDDDSAGGLMSTEVFEISPTNKKSEILKIIQKNYQEIESIYDIYIIDSEQKLIGNCPLSKLLIQTEDIQIGEIMNSEDIKSLSPKTYWKDIASYMSKYNLINVPIIDDRHRLLGIVSVDDILPWLLDER